MAEGEEESSRERLLDNQQQERLQETSRIRQTDDVRRLAKKRQRDRDYQRRRRAAETPEDKEARLQARRLRERPSPTHPYLRAYASAPSLPPTA